METLRDVRVVNGFGRLIFSKADLTSVGSLS